ncbi:hypothetical protein MBLNU459_g2962t1 [Dothideomycetes sp. NU459]
MVKINLSTAIFAASLAGLSAAHPEHHEMEEALHKRNEHAVNIQRGLEACANHPNFLALKARGQDRRWEKAQKLRQARGIKQSTPYKTKRDLTALEAFDKVNHNMTGKGYTDSTASSTLFASYKNVSCILTPEVTDGPYFVTGEYFRTNVTEGQAGVPVHLEYQYIDVSTCDVATGLYLEHWQANATGVYSGIVASGNGNDNDASNINNTFLRGVAKVDSEGVAAFDTIFAGHYEGRATHIHLISQTGGEVFSNGTYAGGEVHHVGQLFFDTALRDAVEATAPYNTNTQAVTTNDDDMWAPDQADNSYDPYPDFAYIGEDISDGLLMWISIGINMTADYTVSAAATLTANGGVADSDSADGSSGSGSGSSGNSTSNTMGMGGSASSGSGSAPSGSRSMGSGPSGSMGGSAPTGSGSAPSGSGSASAAGFSSSFTTSTKVASSSGLKTSSSLSIKTSSSSSSSSKKLSSSSSSKKTTTTSIKVPTTTSKKTSSTKPTTSTKKTSSSTKKTTSSTKKTTSSTKKTTSTKKVTTTAKSSAKKATTPIKVKTTIKSSAHKSSTSLGSKKSS